MQQNEVNQKPIEQNQFLKRAKVPGFGGVFLKENHEYSPSDLEKDFLRYLLEMKYMTALQVEKKFCENKDLVINLRELLKAGYLKTKGDEILSESLIVPLKKSHEYIKSKYPEKLIPDTLTRVFEPAVRHDLLLVDLRIRFEKLRFLERWFSEESLRQLPLMNQAFQDLPDALCRKPNGKSYFLELEISKKTLKDYDTRISNCQKVLALEGIKSLGVEGVIFVCTDPKVVEILKEKTKDLKNISVFPISRYLPEHK